MKRILAFVLSFSILLTAIPLETLATTVDVEFVSVEENTVAEAETIAVVSEDQLDTISSETEDFSYSVSEDGVTITGYRGSDSVVIVPESVEGYMVTAIAERVFAGNANITDIMLPDSITTIGYRAFYNCSSLASINYPLNWSSAGRDIFSGCSSLLEMKVPEGVTSIPDNAFNGANWLLRIMIPNSVTSIK